MTTEPTEFTFTNGTMTILTTLTCLVVLFLCGWQVATGHGILACMGIAGAGLLLIDLGYRKKQLAKQYEEGEIAGYYDGFHSRDECKHNNETLPTKPQDALKLNCWCPICGNQHPVKEG